MFLRILAHKLAQHLCSGLVLGPARFQERFAQIALNPYTETNIFHRDGVYPMDTYCVALSSNSTEIRSTLGAVPQWLREYALAHGFP